MMHGTTNIKFIDAQQAKLAYQYKNTKRKLYKTNAAIWYNKCRVKPLRIKNAIVASCWTYFTTSNFVLRPHKPEWSSCSYYSKLTDITTSNNMTYVSEVATIMFVSCNKPTKCTNFSNLFSKETLYVSDISSVHHQEFFTVYTAIVYVIQIS